MACTKHDQSVVLWSSGSLEFHSFQSNKAGILDTTTCQFFPLPLSTLWVWSSEYNLIFASLHSTSNRLNEWIYFEAPKEDKFVFPHVRKHPTSLLTDNKHRSICAHNKECLCLQSTFQQGPLYHSRHKGLLLISTGDVLHCVLISTSLQ